MKIVHSDAAPKAIGPYSQAIETGGLIFCAGQTPLNPATGKLVEGGVDAQATQALTNLKAVLEAAGSGLDKVVKTTVYLRDMADFQAMNGAYAAMFGDHKPARTTIAVAGLPLDARVEIECIAAK